jgi:hypothetical protein
LKSLLSIVSPRIVFLPNPLYCIQALLKCFGFPVKDIFWLVSDLVFIYDFGDAHYLLSNCGLRVQGLRFNGSGFQESEEYRVHGLEESRVKDLMI